MSDRFSAGNWQEINHRRNTRINRGNGSRGYFAANAHRQYYEQQQTIRLPMSEATPEQLNDPNTRLFGYPIPPVKKDLHPNDARLQNTPSSDSTRPTRRGPAFGIGYRNYKQTNEDISIIQEGSYTESLSESSTRRSQILEYRSELSSKDSTQNDEMIDTNISSGSSMESINHTSYFDPIQDTIQQNQKISGRKRTERSLSDTSRSVEETKRSRAEIPPGTFSAFGSAVREAMIEANIEPPETYTALPEYVREVMQQTREAPTSSNQEIDQNTNRIYIDKLNILKSKSDEEIRVPYFSVALTTNGIQGIINAQEKLAERDTNYINNLKSLKQSIKYIDNKIKSHNINTSWSTNDIETLKSIRRDLDKLRHYREPLDALKKFLDRRE